jgi:hypothetical protein
MPLRRTDQAIMDTGHKIYTQSTPTSALLQIWYHYQMLYTREGWYVELLNRKSPTDGPPVFDG